MERGELRMEYLGTEYVVIVHRDELRAGLVQSAQCQWSVLASVRLRRWLASRLHRPVVRADSPAAALNADMARSPLA